MSRCMQIYGLDPFQWTASPGTRVIGRYCAAFWESGSQGGRMSNAFTSIFIIMFSQALFFFMPFIVSTIFKGHRDSMNTLAAKLENTWKMPLLLFALLLILLGVYLINDNIYLSCIGFLLISWLFMQRHYNDPYGLFHLSLNKLPFEDPNSPGSIGVIGRCFQIQFLFFF